MHLAVINVAGDLDPDVDTQTGYEVSNACGCSSRRYSGCDDWQDIAGRELRAPRCIWQLISTLDSGHETKGRSNKSLEPTGAGFCDYFDMGYLIDTGFVGRWPSAPVAQLWR